MLRKRRRAPSVRLKGMPAKIGGHELHFCREEEPEPRTGAQRHSRTHPRTSSRRHGTASRPVGLRGTRPTRRAPRFRFASASPETAVAGMLGRPRKRAIASFESVERWRPVLAVSLHCTAHPPASNDDRFDLRVKPFADGIRALTRRQNGTSGCMRNREHLTREPLWQSRCRDIARDGRPRDALRTFNETHYGIPTSPATRCWSPTATARRARTKSRAPRRPATRAPKSAHDGHGRNALHKQRGSPQEPLANHYSLTITAYE